MRDKDLGMDEDGMEEREGIYIQSEEPLFEG